ncbi:MAG: hypothetical protein KatS3mg081_0848 [Gemmatimonadales bacterium]|nr:MAG: hypothetical protein KatS3mg081_0848 [Gemmatimonadales bacterium]
MVVQRSFASKASVGGESLFEGCIALPLAWSLLASLAVGCGSYVPEPIDCDAVLGGACWSDLGLKGQPVGALAETPWGLFAGTDHNGIFRFDEGARHWIPLGLDHASISSIVFVPGEPDRLFVGVRPYADEQTDAAVFKSEDRGETWTPSDGGLALRSGRRFWAYSLAVLATQPPTLLMGGPGGTVLRSDSGGSVWSFVLGSADWWGPGVTSIVVSPRRAGRVWAGGTAAVFLPYVLRSDDFGETWQQFFISRNVENAVFALSVDPWNPDVLWAGLWGGVARSDDGGRTWAFSLLLPDPEFPLPSSLVAGLSVARGVLYAASVEHVKHPDGRIGTRLGLYAARDGGMRWDTLPVPPGVQGAHSMITDSQGRLLIGTAGSGVWRVVP